MVSDPRVLIPLVCAELSIDIQTQFLGIVLVQSALPLLSRVLV